jgi:lipopolysaccharide export system ATP-binding protein
MAASQLRVQAISKAYKKRQVVRGVSFSVESGQVLGLLGPNGAGKTTCFYMVVGLVKPDEGEIFLDDHQVGQLPIYKRARLGISYLPQEPSVFRKLTTEENIRVALEAHGGDSAHRREKLEQLLNDFRLQKIRDSQGFALSGGERRRVEIARALAGDPKFLLLDEPFAGIDPIAVADIQEIIRQLKAQGIGVLITDHNVRETLGICDRAYILNEGAVLEEGVPARIAESKRAREIYLGEKFSLS